MCSDTAIDAVGEDFVLVSDDAMVEIDVSAPDDAGAELAWAFILREPQVEDAALVLALDGEILACANYHMNLFIIGKH